MSDEEIPYESPADTADGHLTAAENYLAIAEGQRETLEGGTDLHDAADAVASGMQTGLLFSTACTLADLHRRMAETYWNQPRTLTSVAEQPGDDLLAEMRAQLEERQAKLDARTISCECCASGLYVSGSQGVCADCGHAGDRHNGNAPTPPHAACDDFVHLQPADGSGITADSLCERCGASAQAHVDRGLVHLAEMGAKGGNVPVSEYSRGLDDESERRKAVQSLSDQEFEDMLTLAAEERRRRQEENGIQINAREPKAWRSPGGAGQWNG